MRRGLLFLLLALLSVPVFAGAEDFDIRLGKALPPPPPVDRAKVAAVNRLFADRQAGSLEPRRRGGARSMVAAKVDDETLFGPRSATLLAYDFHDASIRPAGKGAFRVDADLLFADTDGVVVESRDETLTFQGRGKGYVCTSIRTTGSIGWERGGVAGAADSMGAAGALARAQNVLHAWAARQKWNAAYSVADVTRGEDGRVLVQCLRFTATRGQRGYDSKDSTLVLVKESSGGYRVDAN
jgi:hypothetical protein